MKRLKRLTIQSPIEEKNQKSIFQNPFDFYVPYSYNTAKIAYDIITERGISPYATIQTQFNLITVYHISRYFLATYTTDKKLYIAKLLSDTATEMVICNAVNKAIDYYTSLENEKKTGILCLKSARKSTIKTTTRNFTLTAMSRATIPNIHKSSVKRYEDREFFPSLKNLIILRNAYKCEFEDMFVASKELSYNSLEFLNRIGVSYYKDVNVFNQIQARQEIKRIFENELKKGKSPTKIFNEYSIKSESKEVRYYILLVVYGICVYFDI